MIPKRGHVMLGVYFAVVVNSLMFTIVFPISSKMIMYFGLVDSRTETGYWTGLLSGVVLLGRFLSSPVWGMLCDNWGRRPVMLIGIITTSALPILFGMSTNIVWALIFRFLQGLSAPILIAARTIIGEIYTGPEQAGAMSCFNLMQLIGNISGNILGGFLEDPGSSGILDIEIFTHFPFLLPNLVVSGMGFISFLLCLIYLPETRASDLLIQKDESRNFSQLFKDPIVVTVTIMFCINSFTATSFAEVVVLLGWADIDDGGLELQPSEIAVFYVGITILMASYIRFLYTKVVGRFGLSTALRRGLLIYAPIMFGLPVISLFRFSSIAMWVALITYCTTCYSFEFMNSTSILIMLNNSVHPSERGKINGVSMALGNLSRGISPPLFGSVFAATANSGLPYPLNYAFSFILLSGFIITSYLFSRSLPKDLDTPKEVVKDDE